MPIECTFEGIYSANNVGKYLVSIMRNRHQDTELFNERHCTQIVCTINLSLQCIS